MHAVADLARSFLKQILSLQQHRVRIYRLAWSVQAEVAIASLYLHGGSPMNESISSWEDAWIDLGGEG
jgi:hypothetical protein